MTEPLTTERVTPLFRSSFGHVYRFAGEVPSTQDELREDDPEGAIVVADAQSAGRGRRGHGWVAPRGTALLMSVRLRPEGDRPVAQISLVAGVAVAALIERETGRAAGIKWPNDVLIGRAKIAGILAEQRDGAVALGVGVNVNQTVDELPGGTRTQPTSLRALDGRVRDRAPLLASLAEELESRYRHWQASGLAAIADELAARDVLRGRPTRVGSLHGVADGIAASGALVLELDGTRHEVMAGDVEVEW